MVGGGVRRGKKTAAADEDRERERESERERERAHEPSCFRDDVEEIASAHYDFVTTCYDFITPLVTASAAEFRLRSMVDGSELNNVTDLKIMLRNVAADDQEFVFVSS